MLVDLGPLGQQTLLSTSLIGIGGLTLFSALFTLSRALLSIFVLPGKSLSSFGPRGSYAVVTGASDGIGKQYALQLASKGYNLILASRTQSKLEAVAAEVKSKSPSIHVETISIDFSSPSEQDYARLDGSMKGKTVAVLINNVGQSHSIPVTFAETDVAEIRNIVNINCLATLRVTQLTIPHMVPNKKGLILTMGSFGGLTPTPLLATYSGSKAFLQQWSNALAGELEPSGISVYFVHAYLVTSAMSKIRRSTWQIPTERDFVRSVLSKIGQPGGSVGYTYSGSPYWSHGLVALFLTGVAGIWNSRLLRFNRSMHVSIRKRALKKAEREAGGQVEGKKAR